MPDLIIFDCDGTLVETELLYNTTISEILVEAGYTDYTPQKCLDLFTGMTLTTIREKLERLHGVSMNFLERDLYIARAQSKMEDGLSAIPGALDLIRGSAELYKVCIASNGERSSVIKSLQITGLFDCFGEERVFTRSQVPQGKPAPDLFLFAAQHMGCDPKRTIVIEDSVPGALGGLAANMEVYGFAGSHHNPEEHAQSLNNSGVSKTYHSLIHILEDLSRKKASHEQEVMLAQ